jgi:putative effector of murein hydrolase
MGIAEKLGGLPPLSAAVVIATGVLGAVVGPVVLRFLGVTTASAFGLAMGFSAHGIGTARALEIGEEEGAFSSLGLCLNGLMTAVLTPVVLSLLDINF